jgi:ubiquitin C-terminal hydrolase
MNFEINKNNFLDSFLSTTLQCMSSCIGLKKYFLNDFHMDEILEDNSKKLKGNSVKAYYEFLNTVCFENFNLPTTSYFLRIVDDFKALLSKGQKVDLNEFIIYFIDKLHLDLNTPLANTFVEINKPEKSDLERSSLEWENFLNKNNSIITEIFYGQYKLSLYCQNPKCENKQVSFETFLTLSLPVGPLTEPFEVRCYFIYFDLKFVASEIFLKFSSETTIMALRNKISSIYKIHPYSFFIIRMNERGYHGRICNSTEPVRKEQHHNPNTLSYFLFQIDPQLFYSKYNKNMLMGSSIMQMNQDFSKIFDENHFRENYISMLNDSNSLENESGKTLEGDCYYSAIPLFETALKKQKLVKVNTDGNYGFDIENFINVSVNMMQYMQSNLCGRLIFPRILFINLDWTTKRLHKVIFNYFLILIRKKYLERQSLSDEELWEVIFGDIDTLHENDSFEFHTSKDYPYRIRIQNIYSFFDKCCFCGRNTCSNCLLPCDDNITIRQLVEKMPKNFGHQIDNSFLFLNEVHRSKIKNTNKDFRLEVIWLKGYEDVVRTLNDKKDFKLKIKDFEKKATISLDDCFKKLIQVDKQENNIDWFCPSCKNLQKTVKKIGIYKTPKYLILHLNKFNNIFSDSTFVDFPISGLDISKYVKSNEQEVPLIYDLFAIANKYEGESYVNYESFCKDARNGKWYYFKDNKRTMLNEDTLVTTGAFVLFYQKRETENF